jgi:hypothetical protein
MIAFVRDLVDARSRHASKGVYLQSWDRSHARHGAPKLQGVIVQEFAGFDANLADFVRADASCARRVRME